MTSEPKLIHSFRPWALASNRRRGGIFSSVVDLGEHPIGIEATYETLASQVLSIPGVTGVVVREGDHADEIWVVINNPTVSRIREISNLKADHEVEQNTLLDLRLVDEEGELPRDGFLEITLIG